MRENSRNIVVQVENRTDNRGFHVYLNFSGQREYLMTHRHNGLLYELLKDGAVLGDMKRWSMGDIAGKIGYSPRSPRSDKLKNMVDHLLIVIGDYLYERDAC